MSTTPRIIADFETQLATAIAVSGTTFTLSSFVDDDGVTLPNGTYCFTIDNGTSSKEYLMGTMTDGVVTSVQSISRQGVATSGAVRAHRVGASVIITDFIAIKRVADILAGDDTLDGTSPLIYDTAPTLSDPKEVATVAYVLSVVTGGTVYFSTQTWNGTAGETLAAGEMVYFKAADQRWWKMDADDSATYLNVKRGVALGAATAGNGVVVQLSGIASGFTGLSAGSTYYLSATAGAVTSSANTSVRIGVAVSSTAILLDFVDVVANAFLSAVTGQIIMYGSSTAPTGFLACDGSAVSRTTYAALFAVIGTNFGSGDGSTTFNVPDLRSRTPVGYGAAAPTKVLTFASRSSNTVTVTGASNSANNHVQTGQAVLYSAPSGAMTGLTDNTTYYLIRIAYNQFQLASTLANAQNGTAISLSSDGTGAQTFTITLTQRAMGETGGEEKHAMSLTELLAHTHAAPAGNFLASGTDNLGGTSSNSAHAESATASRGGNAGMNIMQPFVGVAFMIKT